MHLDRRLLGWGVFFVLLGAVPLAVRGGLITEDAVGRWWQLWPVLLIGWGLGLLLRRTPADWVGGAVTAVTFGLMGGGLIAAGVTGLPSITCTDQGSTRAFPAQTGALGSVGSLAIQFDCGRLDVATADGSDWKIEGAATDGTSPVVDASSEHVDIRPLNRGDFIGNARTNEWHVTVPRAPTLDTSVTLNAGDGHVDLSGARLGSTSLTVNAGSLDLSLAKAASLGSFSATVNAGSATVSLPAFGGSASVSVNAGSMELCLPASPAVRVHVSGGLGSQNLDTLGFGKIDQNTWVSPGYDSASVRTQMDVSANLGSFTLRVGGGCGA